MNRNLKHAVAAVTLMAAAAACLTACKGRTLDNVTPDGDTVEVIIPVADTAVTTDTANVM